MESSTAIPRFGLSAADVPDVSAALDAPGPFVTVYLATEPAVANAAQQNELRWKALRRELEEAAAPAGAVEAIDPLVPEAHTRGRTLAVVANASGVLVSRHEPEPPRRDLARLGPLPVVGPLLEWAQSAVPHVAVLADRAGADLVTFTRSDDGRVEAVGLPKGNVPDLRRSAPGGWSQRRYQQRAENLWEANAKQVAERLVELVDEIGARVVVAAGDVRALQLLRDLLPDRVLELFQEVGGSRAPGSGLDELADDIVKQVANTVAAETVALLRRFKEERGRGDLAADGAGPTLAALAEARVDTLLVHADPDDGRRAYFGSAPSMVALDPEQVRAMGGGDPQAAPLADVAIRAALLTGAAVRVVPSAASVSEGVGALLRF